MSYTLEDIRREYDRLDAMTGIDTRNMLLRVSGRAVKRLGMFRPGPPEEIVISGFVLEDEEQFWDTIRHEYAHALVHRRHPGERHGHDAVWKAVAREVGCTPRATTAPDERAKAEREAKAKYRLICRGCGQETLYLREGKILRLLRMGRGKNIRCVRCGGNRFELLTKQ
ncbi:MAG: SprT-like domain-containing protein [Oscillospiraceae bacterium]|nr:SprT-like domain-containing protein [Oscillospiraceae bacterium]